jgi:hypothetical protein
MPTDEGYHNRRMRFRLPARPNGRSLILARLPARPQFDDQLSQHFPGQVHHSATAARASVLDTLRPCPVLHPSTVSRRANHA